MQTIPPNRLGLTKVSGWSDLMAGNTLEDQLKKAGVPYEEVEIPHMGTFAGNARLIFYTNPKSGWSVTVLIVVHQSDIDSWAEDYFYFEGMTKEGAMADENWWIENYDEFEKLSKKGAIVSTTVS